MSKTRYIASSKMRVILFVPGLGGNIIVHNDVIIYPPTTKDILKGNTEDSKLVKWMDHVNLKPKVFTSIKGVPVYEKLMSWFQKKKHYPLEKLYITRDISKNYYAIVPWLWHYSLLDGISRVEQMLSMLCSQFPPQILDVILIGHSLGAEVIMRTQFFGINISRICLEPPQMSCIKKLLFSGEESNHSLPGLSNYNVWFILRESSILLETLDRKAIMDIKQESYRYPHLNRRLVETLASKPLPLVHDKYDTVVVTRPCYKIELPYSSCPVVVVNTKKRHYQLTESRKILKEMAILIGIPL